MIRYGYTEYIYSEKLLDYKKHDIENYDLLKFECIYIEIKPHDENEQLLKVYIKSEVSHMKNIFNINTINNYLWDTTFLTSMFENYYTLFYDLFTKYLNESIVTMIIDIYRNRSGHLPIDVDVLKSYVNNVYGGLMQLEIPFDNIINVYIGDKYIPKQPLSLNVISTLNGHNINYPYMDIFNSAGCEDPKCVNHIVFNPITTGFFYGYLLPSTSCFRVDYDDVNSLKFFGGKPVYTYTNYIKSISSFIIDIDKNNYNMLNPFFAYIGNNYVFSWFISDCINQKFKTNSILQTYISPLFINLSDFINTHNLLFNTSEFYYLHDDKDSIIANIVKNFASERTVGNNILPLVNDIFEFGKNYLIQIHEYLVTYPFSFNTFYTHPIKQATCSYPINIAMISEDDRATLEGFYDFMFNDLFTYNSVFDLYSDLNNPYRYNFYNMIGDEFSGLIPKLEITLSEMNINEGEYFLRIVDLYNNELTFIYRYIIPRSEFFSSPYYIEVNDGIIDISLPIAIGDDAVFNYYISGCNENNTNSVFIPRLNTIDINSNLSINYLMILPIKFTFNNSSVDNVKAITEEFGVYIEDIFNIQEIESYSQDLDDIYTISFSDATRYDICANTVDKWAISPLRLKLRRNFLFFIPFTNTLIYNVKDLS